METMDQSILDPGIFKLADGEEITVETLMNLFCNKGEDE